MTNEPGCAPTGVIRQNHISPSPLSQHPAFLRWIMTGVIAVLMTACAPDHGRRTIRDLQTIPQNASIASQEDTPSVILPAVTQETAAQDYLTRFFSPWNINGSTLYTRGKLLGATTDFQNKPLVGENLNPWPQGRLEHLIAQYDRASFPNAHARAITIQDTPIRALPSNHPGFYPFDRPGEGYPFDYLQYSVLWAGTPIHICHIAVNRAWALVEAGFVHGWMPVSNLAFVDASFVKRFQSIHCAVPLQDTVPLIDTEGVYRFMTHIGALYPVETDAQGRETLLLPAADASRHALLVRADMPADTMATYPLPLTRTNQAALAQQLLGQAYGWGGMYFNRDCSAMTRDFMGSFGIWLPRNSSQQAKQGHIIALADMPAAQKEDIIQKQGIPFQTLIWMPGHVTLYIGQYQGHALIMHNTWGLKTRTWSGKEGRQVIGKTVITTLEPGAELPDLDRPKGLLINKVTGMSILP